MREPGPPVAAFATALRAAEHAGAVGRAFDPAWRDEVVRLARRAGFDESPPAARLAAAWRRGGRRQSAEDRLRGLLAGLHSVEVVAPPAPTPTPTPSD
ncbi:hypothetical protein [Alienimonas sp. DA493]|uniref:hypothetical protein n=1 Tax=Alienimonas sp. DA493 TaxID=3373605 RepID=UPI003753EED1